MINMGMQGSLKLEDQVDALHIYVDELNAKMAKLLLMAHYKSYPSTDHVFPLHMQMQLVPEINSVLHQGQEKCGKVMCLPKYVEQDKIELYQDLGDQVLDSQSRLLWISLWDAMMAIWHPKLQICFIPFGRQIMERIMLCSNHSKVCGIPCPCNDICSLTLPAMEDYKGERGPCSTIDCKVVQQPVLKQQMPFGI